MATTPKPTADKNTATDSMFGAFPAAFMANLPNTSMNGYANWWQAYMTGATEMNKEIMKFVAMRLQHDAELGESLAKCSDWTDAMHVQEEFVRTMSKEYMSEAGTFMKIASAIGQESWTAANGDAGANPDSGRKSKDK